MLSSQDNGSLMLKLYKQLRQHFCSLVDFSLIITCKVKTYTVLGAFLGAEHDKANLEALSCIVRKISAVVMLKLYKVAQHSTFAA